MCVKLLQFHMWDIFVFSTHGKFSNLHLGGCKNRYIKSVVVSYTADSTLDFTK